VLVSLRVLVLLSLTVERVVMELMGLLVILVVVVVVVVVELHLYF